MVLCLDHLIKDHFIHRFGINQKLLPFTFFGFENYVLYQGLWTSSYIAHIDFPQCYDKQSFIFDAHVCIIVVNKKKMYKQINLN